MAFYFSVPHGNMPLARLEEFAHQRLQFLVQLSACKGDVMQATDLCMQLQNVEHSECLIHGTVKDKISHFILRLASCLDPEMTDVIYYAETQLFAFRLSCMTKEEKYKFLLSLTKNVKDKNMTVIPQYTMQGAVSVLADILAQMTLTELVEGWDGGRTDITISIPFQFSLNLVARRKVDLHRGLVEVPVCMLNSIFQSIFECMLKVATKVAKKKLDTVMEDDRFKDLFYRLKDVYFKYSCKQSYSISNTIIPMRCEDVNIEVDMFPPCMSHLHRQLRLRHRLSHYSRVKYTLFLKECGMPVHEALRFWKEEYSQKHNHSTGCRHEWSKEKERYTYNIRHLHGLEGARKNYRAACCGTMQKQQPGPTEEWGCPFKHFDTTSLTEILDIEDILQETQSKCTDFIKQGDHDSACKVYFIAKLSKTLKSKGIREDIHLFNSHKFTAEKDDIKDNHRMSKLTFSVLSAKPSKLTSDSFFAESQKEKEKVPAYTPFEYHTPREYYQQFKSLLEGLNSV